MNGDESGLFAPEFTAEVPSVSEGSGSLKFPSPDFPCIPPPGCYECPTSMEDRIQTYLAALQCLTVLAGSFLLSVSMRFLEEVLVSGHGRGDSLALARALSSHGLWLLALPALWVAVTLNGKRKNRPWAGRRMILVTGTLLLALLTALYFVAVVIATNPLRSSLQSVGVAF